MQLQKTKTKNERFQKRPINLVTTVLVCALDSDIPSFYLRKLQKKLGNSKIIQHKLIF